MFIICCSIVNKLINKSFTKDFRVSNKKHSFRLETCRKNEKFSRSAVFTLRGEFSQNKRAHQHQSNL